VLTLPRSVKVFLATARIDMRCGHDGLCAIVHNQWQLDPFTDGVFAFVGKRGDRIKYIYWSRGGFVLVYKRLERGRFKVPRVDGTATRIEIDAVQLSMLLDGIDFGRIRRPDLWSPPTKNS
jgi:transposase